MGSKNFIQGAIKHKGALRATAKKKGLVKGDQPLSSDDLEELSESGDTTTKRRVALAKTLKGMKTGSRIKKAMS